MLAEATFSFLSTLPLPADLGPREYSVTWFTLSLINAGLAQGKNRSGLAWWLVSLLLGPFATFLIVVLDRVPPQRSPKR